MACLPLKAILAIHQWLERSSQFKVFVLETQYEWILFGMQALSFMLAQFGETGLAGRSKQSIIDPDAENFRNIYATIRFLADRVT